MSSYPHPTSEMSCIRDNAQTYLQLLLRHWGAGNVYLLVLSSSKVNIAEKTHCRNGCRYVQAICNAWQNKIAVSSKQCTTLRVLMGTGMDIFGCLLMPMPYKFCTMLLEF